MIHLKPIFSSQKLDRKDNLLTNEFANILNQFMIRYFQAKLRDSNFERFRTIIEKLIDH